VPPITCRGGMLLTRRLPSCHDCGAWPCVLIAYTSDGAGTAEAGR